ncbi:6-phosphogluconolactonase [Nocardioides yefusunii]|uniref:6-phosphogluconolactonase n=1 Tax=Nocardioides yefusunii TaxID=2500546 RepID=A0ABW1R1L7_9ACTN|nr:6-phosphogluconolactonase [Nocardioides yefusunii]
MSAAAVTHVVRSDPDGVASTVADALVALLVDLTPMRDRVDVVLTGGTVAATVHRALASRVRVGDEQITRIRWSSLHLWWGDERFVGADDPERNHLQVHHDLLHVLPLRPEQVHPFPAAPERAGAAELSAAALVAADDLSGAPECFDLVMLGTGPDGHVASLFPGHTDQDVHGDVVAVRDSPKPPPMRLSLTAERLARTQRLWAFATGAGKAESVALASAGSDLPLGTVSAAARADDADVIWFLDDEAASLLTE